MYIVSDVEGELCASLHLTCRALWGPTRRGKEIKLIVYEPQSDVFTEYIHLFTLLHTGRFTGREGENNVSCAVELVVWLHSCLMNEHQSDMKLKKEWIVSTTYDDTRNTKTCCFNRGRGWWGQINTNTWHSNSVSLPMKFLSYSNMAALGIRKKSRSRKETFTRCSKEPCEHLHMYLQVKAQLLPPM